MRLLSLKARSASCMPSGSELTTCESLALGRRAQTVEQDISNCSRSDLQKGLVGTGIKGLTPSGNK
jgi:hypothetical protein